MGNVYMEAEQIRYKSDDYHNVQEGLDAAFAGSPEGLDERVSALETTVGDSSAGLVKTVTDQGTAISGLETTVGDSSAGLVKDVNGLKSDNNGISIALSDYFTNLPTGISIVEGESFVKRFGNLIFGNFLFQAETNFTADNIIFTIARPYRSNNVVNSVAYFRDTRWNPLSIKPGYFYMGGVASGDFRVRDIDSSSALTFCTVTVIYQVAPPETRENGQEPETKSTN